MARQQTSAFGRELLGAGWAAVFLPGEPARLGRLLLWKPTGAAAGGSMAPTGLETEAVEGKLLGSHLRQQLSGGARGQRGRQILLDRDLLALVVDRQVHHAKAARGELAHHPVAANHGIRRQRGWFHL